MHAEAEYVYPRILLPYREHAWSRDHNRDGVEAWDALRDEVARDGFREAAVLSYNHKTGRGYLGEGNHRVGIALELGIPVPLVILRSTKTEPDFPMRPITAPGEHSMRDDRGFSQFRVLMRPSDIGLPTVETTRDKTAEGEAIRRELRLADRRDQESNRSHRETAVRDLSQENGGIEL
jgi:hypothetical protein